MLEGGEIRAIGLSQDLCARYPASKQIRVERITPGLHDAHAHPLYWGEQLGLLDLAGLSDPREVAGKVAETAKNMPVGTWLRGSGFLFETYPSKELLDQAAPHQPVFLQSRDLHSAWVNTRGLEAARITASSTDPEGGKILRDSSGEPTGYLLERATSLVGEVLPQPGIQVLEKGLKDFARRGYTAVHHMGWCSAAWAIELAERGSLPVRLWWALDKEDWQAFEPGWHHGLLHLAAVKFFADGALGSRTAWMHRPYPDGSFGMPLDDLEEIRQRGEIALKKGFTLAVHAIGTRAVAGVLEVFKTLAPFAKAPLRLEHAQHVRDQELRLMNSLPLALSMQPSHLLEDTRLVRRHLLGREREAFRFRDLWNTAKPMAFGSDAPVAAPSVADTLAAATGHAFNPEQSLTKEECLYAFTRGASLAAGWSRHGVVAVSAPADLTLWEGDTPIGRVFAGELELF